MKKLITFTLVISMLFCMAACGKKAGDMDSTNGSTVNAANPGGETENSTSPGADAPAAATPAEEPLHRLGPRSSSEVFAYYKELYGKTAASGEELDIPVYYEEDLLFSTHNNFYLDVDATEYLLPPLGQSGLDYCMAMDFLQALPTVLRVQEGSRSYAVYDTQTGYRIYIILEERFFTGYLIAISKNGIRSYADFADIQIGDTLEKVEAIDDVATLYRRDLTKFYDISNFSEGSTFFSMHYLTDGILKITYRISKAEGINITVSEMAYYEDYVIPTANGSKISHKICDIDLPDNTPTVKMPLHRIGPAYDEEAFANYLKYYGIAEDSDKALDIPVYYEEELLFHKFDYFSLTQDASAYVKTALTAYVYALATLHEMPTQLRVRADGSSYAVYDTDTGYRYFLFIHKSNICRTGYPILINKSKMLSRADFANIQVGDSIDKVIQIDDVASLHKKKIDSRNYKSHADFFANQIMSGREVVTIHYLTDGILKISYQVDVEIGPTPEMTVSGIEFYEDYVIPTADGEMTSHKIKDIDLPQP